MRHLKKILRLTIIAIYHAVQVIINLTSQEFNDRTGVELQRVVAQEVDQWTERRCPNQAEDACISHQ